MYTTPNTDTMQGRQLQGLLDSTNRRARMVLTVDITTAAGKAAYHQVYRVKAWTSQQGQRMLTLDLDDGDWAAGTYATKVCHVNTATGDFRPAKGMADKALLYGAQAVLYWAFTGKAVPNTKQGSTVQVQAAAVCGCCGQQLTHPVSLTLGIGPECAKKLGLEHHYGGSKVLATERKAAKAKAAAPAAAPAAPAVDDLTPEERRAYSSYVSQGYGDTDGYFGPLTPQAWVAGYRRDKAAQAPAQGSLAAVVATLASAQNATVGSDEVDVLGAPYSEEERLARAALRQAERDIALVGRQRDQALRRGDWDRAQQLDDQLDTLRGMRGKYQAELAYAGVVVA